MLLSLPLFPSLSLSHTHRTPVANVIFHDFSTTSAFAARDNAACQECLFAPCAHTHTHTHTHSDTHHPCPSCQSSRRKSVPTLSLNCVPFDAWLAWKLLSVKLNIFNATSPHHTHTHTHIHTPSPHPGSPLTSTPLKTAVSGKCPAFFFFLFFGKPCVLQSCAVGF